MVNSNIKKDLDYYRSIFYEANDAIYIHDINTGNIIDVNQKALDMFGYQLHEAFSISMENGVSKVSRYTPIDIHKIMRKVSEGEPQIFEWLAKHKNGKLFWVEVNLKKAVIGGEERLLAIVRDISKRKKIERELIYISLHDPLTGLYNRAHFTKETDKLSNTSTTLGIIICDVDYLKFINDTMGHILGDMMLKNIANIIKKTFSKNEIVARIGGDEFAILLKDCNEIIVKALINKLYDALETFNQTNTEIHLSISCGYAISSKKPTALLLQEADDQMYREKFHMRNQTRKPLYKNLTKSLEVKDFLKEGHAERIKNNIIKTATALDIPFDTNLISLLAQFHDVGKVGIPVDVLFKKEPLTLDEISIVRRHCVMGYRIAQYVDELVPISDWILKHHEWWNGAGYPLGIKYEEIPIECRIFSIADAFDVMTSTRPYRKVIPHKDAIRELKKCAGFQFDPYIVKTFIKVVDN